MKLLFRTLLLGFSVLLLNACKQHISYVLKVQLRELSPEMIYELKEVEAVMFDKQELSNDSIRIKSSELFLKGADEYHNKKSPAMATIFFKKSILVLPQAKTYFELGNALSEFNKKEQFDEALKAYSIALELGYQPLNRVYYNQAICEAKRLDLEGNEYGNWNVYHPLKQALAAGFQDFDAIRKEKVFNRLKNSDQFELLLTTYMTKKEASEKDPLMALYLKGFGLVNSNFAIDTTALNLDGIDNSISYDFKMFIPEMQNMEFAREVSHEYYYVSKVKETENYTAVIYATVSFWEEMSPRTFTLAVYNNEGERVSSLNIACNCDAYKVKTAKIEHGKIYVQDLAREWLYNTDKVPFDENAVKAYIPINSAIFDIDSKGKIIEVEVPNGYTDTVKFAQRKVVKSE